MLTLPELESVMDTHVPRWRTYAVIESLATDAITVRLPFHDDLLRAGGTISGPALMALADRAAYMLAIVHAGDPRAVTANLDIHFLARARPTDVIATATLLRLGRRLVVSSVDMLADSHRIARATVTYALVSNPT